MLGAFAVYSFFAIPMNNLSIVPQLKSQLSNIVTADNLLAVVSYLDCYLDDLAMVNNEAETSDSQRWYNASGYCLDSHDLGVIQVTRLWF